MKYKDTQARALSKTATYRVGGSLIMFFLILTMLGQDSWTAFNMVWKISIIGAVTFYIHEVIWGRLQFKKVGAYEQPLRSIVKTASWRIYSFLILAFLTWFLSKTSAGDSLVYSAVLNILLLVFHYVHERLWNKTSWGKYAV
jgi:uncharacterized membrane protein